MRFESIKNINDMKNLQDQLNEWKARRAEAENEMVEALKCNDDKKYIRALFAYRYTDGHVISILECIGTKINK